MAYKTNSKMKNRYLALILLMILVFGIILIGAHTEEHFAKAEEIIKQEIPCEELTDEQLEIIGDYLMELMHPGEAHELMHDMMGGEDSETVKLMHINMAEMMYCNEGQGMNNMMNMMSNGMMSGGMMPMMNMMSGNMMSSEMMGGNMMTGGVSDNMMNYRNAYGNNIFGYGVFGMIFAVLVLVILTLVIALLIKQLTKKGK